MLTFLVILYIMLPVIVWFYAASQSTGYERHKKPAPKKRQAKPKTMIKEPYSITWNAQTGQVVEEKYEEELS